MTKYRAVPTEVDGILFHSKGEAGRYSELRILQRQGVITDLRLQPCFQITVAGQKICKYKADFIYFEDGKEVIEDFKGMETPVFRLKWKLVQALFPQYVYKKTG